MSEVSGTIGAKGEKMKAEKDAKDGKSPKKKGAAAAAPSVGVALDRHFTKIGVDPLDEVTYERQRRMAEIEREIDRLTAEPTEPVQEELFA